MPWKWCGRLPERKSNPITVFPTGLALLETLYPKWGTLSRVFRLSATAGSLFCFRFRSVGVGGVAYRFRKYPEWGTYTGSCISPLTYCKKNVGLVEPKRSELKSTRAGAWCGICPRCVKRVWVSALKITLVGSWMGVGFSRWAGALRKWSAYYTESPTTAAAGR